MISNQESVKKGEPRITYHAARSTQLKKAPLNWAVMCYVKKGTLDVPPVAKISTWRDVKRPARTISNRII